MAKQNKADGAVQQDKPVAKLAVKSGLKFRGARAAWYEALCAHDGQEPSRYLEACAANPPSLTKKGTAENPTGWLRYFLRTGAAELK